MRNQITKYGASAAPGARAARHPFRQRWLHRALVAAAASIVAVAPASVSAQSGDCVAGVVDHGTTSETWTIPAFRKTTVDTLYKGSYRHAKLGSVSITIRAAGAAISSINVSSAFGSKRRTVLVLFPRREFTPSAMSDMICAGLKGKGVPLYVSFLDEGGQPSTSWDTVSCATVTYSPSCEPPTTGDTDPPIVTCPPSLTGDDAIPYNFYDYPENDDPADNGCAVTGGVPAPGSPFEFVSAFGGSVSDNVTALENLSMCISDSVDEESSCPVVITRTYTFTDEANNTSEPCAQTIHVNNLFIPETAIIWHQPLARKGMSEDTDPSDGDTLKYRFKLGQTIPIKIHALGCDGDVTANSNVCGTVKVYGDVEDEWVEAGDVIDYNGVGGDGGEMDKIGGHLRYNLNTKTLREISDTNCYRLEVTVTDESTGESVSEIVSLQAK